jgi:enoyl-CoA hydratase/carnithine racemase
MSGDLVLYEPGVVGTLRLNHPPLNLITTEVVDHLGSALAKVEVDPDIRVLVMTGAGDRAFCAGSDITEFAGLQGRVGEGKLIRENQVYDRVANLPLPTIAVLEGDALGGGLELALCCDLRVASTRARLGMPEVRLGVIPGSGGTYRLPRLVGPARAAELILMGEIITAEEALNLGLVNRLVETGLAETEARRMAEEIAARAPLAVATAKQAMAAYLRPDAREVSLEMSERVFASRDLIEGVRAFKEKRPPNFRGH